MPNHLVLTNTFLQHRFLDLGKMEKNFDDEVTMFKDDVSRFINKVENTLLYVPEPVTTKKKTRKEGQSREGGDPPTEGRFEDDVDDGRVRHIRVAILSLEGEC